MRAADLITASVLALMGGVVLFDAMRLGFRWSTDGPQSGFFPFYLGLLMITACAAILVQSARRAPGSSFVTREQLAPVLKVLVPAVVTVAAMHFIGFYVATALYIGFYMRWVGRHSWIAVIVLAIVIPIATFMIFEQWFLVPLPKGPLESWLGY